MSGPASAPLPDPATSPAIGPLTGPISVVSGDAATCAILYPGHGAQDEFAWLETRLSGVRLPVEHTGSGPMEHTPEALLRMGERRALAPVASIAARRHGAGSVMWACSSGSFVLGATGAHRQARWLSDAARVPAATTTVAFLEAMRSLRITKVAVAATYAPPITGLFVHLLAEEGYRVVSCASHQIGSSERVGALTPEQVLRVIGDRFAADVEAVLVPDTALRTLAHVDELERSLDKVVLTANQVTAWYGLRLAGWHGRAPGLGRLFM